MKSSLARTCDRHEKEKKREYNYRVMNIDQGTFTPLVHTVFGTVGKECDKFYKHLSQKISEKCNERYDDVINWIRCKVSFMCLKSCIMCIRGTRTIKKDNIFYVSDDFKMDAYNANI